MVAIQLQTHTQNGLVKKDTRQRHDKISKFFHKKRNNEATQSKISVLRGISKPLQRLPRYTGFWVGRGVCHILQSWVRFFLCP